MLLLFSFAVMGVWLFLPVLRQTLDLASREADPICRDGLQIAQDVSVTMRHVAVTGTVTGPARPTGHNAMSRATPTHPVETVANIATGRSRRHDRASHAMHSPSGYNCKETTTTADIAFHMVYRGMPRFVLPASDDERGWVALATRQLLSKATGTPVSEITRGTIFRATLLHEPGRSHAHATRLELVDTPTLAAPSTGPVYRPRRPPPARRWSLGRGRCS